VEGRLVEGRLVEGHVVGRTFYSEGRFVEGRFVLAPKITQVGVHGSTPCLWLLAIVSPELFFIAFKEDDMLFFLLRALPVVFYVHTDVHIIERQLLYVYVYISYGTSVEKLPEDMISWLLLILLPFY
jgi:hypothetical protein